MATQARERFTAVVSGPRAAANLAEAALLIAAEEQESAELDLDAYMQRYLDALDTLAAGAQARIAAAEKQRRTAVLIDYLAGKCGFHGNQDDYYDLRNSYLDEVLDRRVGIPITLAVVYIEIGRRSGLEIHGVGFPGHFLALHNGPAPTIIDPFYGTALDEAACAERLRAIAGPDASFDSSLLAVATTQQILTRMLGNLKVIHLRSKNFARALSCSERILLVHPDLPTELRDRAALYLQLECFDAARNDLERFLDVAPDHESAEIVRQELVRLRSEGPALH